VTKETRAEEPELEEPPEEPEQPEETLDLMDEQEERPELLNLSSLVPTRRMVKLPITGDPKGYVCQLRLIEDFGIETQQRLIAWGKEFQKLYGSDTVLKEAGRERLRFLLDHLFDDVIDAPVSVKEKIPDTIKNKVIQAFTWAPLLAQQELQSQVIQRLIDRGNLTQGQVDEVLEEMRQELSARQTTGS
jgi:hypothetical protein